MMNKYTKVRVLLVFPPNINTVEPFKSASRKQYESDVGFPLGIGYIASCLRDSGRYDVKLLDAMAKGYCIEDVISLIREYDPSYIGITVNTLNARVVVELASKIKGIWGQGKIVIAGGPHASDDYENLLTRYPYFDYIVRGEGEQTTLELLQALDGHKKETINDIQGLAYPDQGSGAIVVTPNRELPSDIDSYPFPARDLLDMDDYIHRETVLPYAVDVMSSRGCTNRCVFCSFQRKWRRRSAQNIIREVRELTTRYPSIKSIAFQDDAFSVDKERVINFCKEILKEGLQDYIWSCSCRVDQMDEEMISWMHKAGCRKILYGIESADPEILRNLNKRIDMTVAKRIIDLTTRAGIDTVVTLIVGNPGETYETVDATYNFVKKLNCAAFVLRVMNVYPGTALAKMQYHEDYVSYIYEPEIEKPSLYIPANIVSYEKNPGMDREEQKRLVSKTMRKLILYKILTHPLYSLKKLYRMPLVAVSVFIRIFRLS